MSENKMTATSGNLLIASGVTPEKAIRFLGETARYFENRPTGGEDSAYWANVYNAEWCREISTLIASLQESTPKPSKE